MVTTAQGETLLGLARRILGLLARAGERVSEASHPLRLGVPEDFAAGAMTPVLAAFARTHPQVRLEVQSDLSHALWQAFEGGELDLALDHHQLLKVRVSAGDRDLRDDLIAQLVEASRSTLVSRIGNVAALYRANPKKRDSIPLPKD